MSLLILFASRSGNNRLLADTLAQRLNADLEEIRDTRRFRLLRLPGDLKRDRHPPIAAITHDVAGYDQLLCIAPIYDRQIAPAMKTALAQVGPQARRLSFATFCGYHRPGQREAIEDQLRTLTGREPVHVAEFWVGDLVPPEDRDKVRIVSGYQVRPEELSQFEERLREIESWFSP